jgi:class 3 adenylate cyclase
MPTPQGEPQPSAAPVGASRIEAPGDLEAEPAQETRAFREWAGADKGYFHIVSSDVAESTRFLENHGRDGFKGAFLPRFEQAAALAKELGGYVLRKATGDGFIGFFTESLPAVEFALKFIGEPGRFPEYPKQRLIYRLLAWFFCVFPRFRQAGKPEPTVSRQAYSHSSLSFGIGVEFGIVETETVDLTQGPIARACRIADLAKKDPQTPVWASDQIRQDIVDKCGLMQANLEWMDKREQELKGFRQRRRLWGVRRNHSDNC